MAASAKMSNFPVYVSVRKSLTHPEKFLINGQRVSPDQIGYLYVGVRHPPTSKADGIPISWEAKGVALEVAISYAKEHYLALYEYRQKGTDGGSFECRWHY
jgi:hypothetical protein